MSTLKVIKIAHEHDIPVMMGALSPTEISTAYENGADIIKLFPAGAMGITYFKAVRAPLDQIPFFVVGGIKLENTAEWMQAGASGIGIGSSLTKSEGEDPIQAIKITCTGIFINLLAQES